MGPFKLQSALKLLGSATTAKPSIFCSETWGLLVDSLPALIIPIAAAHARFLQVSINRTLVGYSLYSHWHLINIHFESLCALQLTSHTTHDDKHMITGKMFAKFSSGNWVIHLRVTSQNLGALASYHIGLYYKRTRSEDRNRLSYLFSM
jgi:hypothetical protein